MSKITINRPDDESLTVLLDDKVLISVNHDCHGWEGIEVVEKLTFKFAEALGIDLVYTEDEE